MKKTLTLISLVTAIVMLLSMTALAAPVTPQTAITVVATATNTRSSNEKSLTINVPTGTAAGDVMLAAITLNNNITITAPAGWTSVVMRQRDNDVKQQVFSRVAGASEPASYTFTTTSNSRWTGSITSFRGVDTTNPIAASASADGSSSSNAVAPTVTAIDNSALVCFFAIEDDDPLGTPSGMTSLAYLIAHDVLASRAAWQSVDAGATGTRSSAIDSIGAEDWVAHSIVLRPRSETSLTVDDASATYGDTSVDLVATLDDASLSIALVLAPYENKEIVFYVDGNLAGTATTDADGVATYDFDPSDLTVGDYQIVALFAGEGPYYGAIGTGTLTIDKKAASVTPDDLDKLYGDTDPTLTGTLDGFLSRDNVTADYARDAGEAVGEYDIDATLDADDLDVLDNYDITYNTGTFEIIDYLDTISVKTEPKTEYEQGEDFDVTGGVITENYASGATKDVDMTLGMLTGYDKDTLGVQTITVTHECKTTSFDVTVALKVLEDDPNGVYVANEDDSFFDPNLILQVERLASDSPAFATAFAIVDNDIEGMDLFALYDIRLMLDSVSVQPDGTLVIYIRIPAELLTRQQLGIVHIVDGVATELDSIIIEYEGNFYLVFETDSLSNFGIIALEDAPIVTTGESQLPVAFGLLLLAGAAGLFIYRRRQLQ